MRTFGKVTVPWIGGDVATVMLCPCHCMPQIVSDKGPTHFYQACCKGFICCCVGAPHAVCRFPPLLPPTLLAFAPLPKRCLKPG